MRTWFGSASSMALFSASVRAVRIWVNWGRGRATAGTMARASGRAATMRLESMLRSSECLHDRGVRCLRTLWRNSGGWWVEYWCVVRDELSCGTPVMLGGEVVGPTALRTTAVGRSCNTKGVYATERPDACLREFAETLDSHNRSPQERRNYHRVARHVQGIACAPVPVFSVIPTKHYRRLCF
jgi:hypothetical protein